MKPGLTCDLQFSGHINIRSLQSMLTAARFLAYHTKDEQTGCAFLEYDKLTEDKFTFMASTKVTVNKRLYELSRREELKRKQSLAVSLSLGYTGTSSLNSVARLYCPDTEDTYVDNINQVVAVSKTTRKPVPLDDWWKQKYQTYSVGTQPLVIPLIDIPSKTHVYEVKVPWTDIDNYKHTNYVNYIRYCQDAALDATFAEFYSKVKGDFLGYLIKEMLISYKGESVANDILEVKTWENVENPFILHFSIQKDGRTIFQNTIKLYE